VHATIDAETKLSFVRLQLYVCGIPRDSLARAVLALEQLSGGCLLGCADDEFVVVFVVTV
jgi:hypothetical protein